MFVVYSPIRMYTGGTRSVADINCCALITTISVDNFAKNAN